MARRRLSADDAKTMILSYAKLLFIEKGYDRATMDHLCQLTQMSKGNLYHHFKNKEDLFLQLLTQHVEDLAEKWLSPENQNRNATDHLLAIADEYGRACKHPLMNAAEEFGRKLSKDSDAFTVLKKSVDLLYNIIEQVVQNGIDNKALKDMDAESMTFAVSSMLVGTANYCWTMPNLSADEYASYHVNAMKLLLGGISAK